LPYNVLRTASSPDEVLLAFLQSTYEAAATYAKWDRNAMKVKYHLKIKAFVVGVRRLSHYI
jgi:hypothetical protein